MKRARAIRVVVCCSLALGAFGCAQIAGLGGEYQLGSGGAGGAAGSSGMGVVGGTTGASGGANASGGSSASGGARGGAGPSGGAGAVGGTSPNGGSGGAVGGAGPSGGAAGSNGGAAGSGGTGAAGGSAGGDTAAGPVRVGFSEFHDSAAGNDQASSSLPDATFTKPAGTTAGDFILVFFGADHDLGNLSGTKLTAAGWTLKDQHEGYGTDGQATYLIYKIAGASEPDPIVFAGINPAGSGNGVQGLLSVYRGVNTAMPINAYEVNVFQTGQSVTQVMTATPAITTTTANCLLVAGLSPDTTVDAPVITAWPQGFTESQVSVNNPLHPYPYGWANIYSAERHLAAASLAPASAFSWTVVMGGQYYGALTFVLALAPK